MEDEFKEDFVLSEFRHCVVDWEIENFGYAAYGMKYELESPCFEAKPFTALWRFVLKSDQGLCDDTEMLFSLERIDREYETIWVSYDVSLTDQNKKKWKGARGEYHFKPNDKHCFSVPNIYYDEVKASVYNFHFMTIRCQMIVAYDEKYSYCDLTDSSLKGLSEDLDELYGSGKFSDMTIKLNDNAEIAAHKAVLSVRNECVKNNLPEDDPSVLNCSSLHLDGIKQVLRYIYTGDFVKAVDNPLISVYDCIDYLSIDELKIHFKINEIKLKSSIEVHQTGHFWKIENFCGRNEKCIVSNLISSNLLEMVWMLSLYPKGVDGNGEYLAVIAENVKGKINGKVWAKVEIYTNSSRREWKTMKEIKQGEVFEIQNLDEWKSASEKLEDGSLRIGFKASVSLGVKHTSVYQVMHTIQRTSLEDYYNKLSKDIFQLRKDAKYSDVVIVAQNESFTAHKCILSVRCTKLGDQLENLKEDKTITIESIRPKIVGIILDYMYSGFIHIEELDCSEVIEVYEAAVKIGVKHLQPECSKYLCQNINMDNLVQILTIACEEKDYELESAALKFAKKDLMRG